MENCTVTRVELGNCCCAEILKCGNAQFLSSSNSQKVKQWLGTVWTGGSQLILSIPSYKSYTSLSKSASLTFLKLIGSNSFSSFYINSTFSKMKEIK